ncbi:MAG: MFS transporter [Minwuiales bacterium]|nr:MFS transporter [Minwuiales bacterium]
MPPAATVAAICIAQIVGMASFATFPALMPTFFGEWSLSNTEGGWLNGIYYAGYLTAVPILVSLTDRVDARPVYLTACLVTAASALGFAVLADGFWSALVWRALGGAGLAGTYMVGLKALTDRIELGGQSRSVAFYTASFSIGASLSYFLAGWFEPSFGWRAAFALAAIGPAVAFGLVLAVLRPRRQETQPDTRLLDFRPVLRNRKAMGYVLAYTAHNWELFGFRSWIVTFLVFSAALQPDGASGWLAATTLAALINMLGLPASVIGNEFASRFGRRRVVIALMLISAAVSCLLGFSATWPFALVVALFCVSGVAVSWDSSSITAGAVADADPAYRGATMAVHSMFGFAGAFVGPLVFGVVLDLAGGGTSLTAWGFAFISMGLGVAAGPLALWLLSGKRAA